MCRLGACISSLIRSAFVMSNYAQCARESSVCNVKLRLALVQIVSVTALNKIIQVLIFMGSLFVKNVVI